MTGLVPIGGCLPSAGAGQFHSVRGSKGKEPKRAPEKEADEGESDAEEPAKD